MGTFSAAEERAIAAIADRVYRDRLSAQTARRGRPPKSERAVTPAPRYAWLPEGRLVATKDDVMRALDVRRSTLYGLVQRGVLKGCAGPVRGLHFDPAEVESYIERMRRRRAA